MSTRRGFGSIRRLPSKRYQASYTGPDGLRHVASATFVAKADAEGWLAKRRAEVMSEEWQPPTPKVAPFRFGQHAERWLLHRPLKPRTRDHYRWLLETRLLPTFGAVSLKAISADQVDAWHLGLGGASPTTTAHAYGLLRTLLGDAVQRRLIPFNPVHIRGAGNVKRARKIRPATVAELGVLVEAMPSKYRLLVLLASWCALRFGEATELRRSDIDLRTGKIRIRRGVVRAKEVPDPLPAGTRLCGCRPGCLVGTTKSEAGVRDVGIPPHLLPLVREHLAGTIAGGRDGLLFPAADGIRHLSESTLTKSYYRARGLAGRPDLRFHDLRHTGAVMAAATGATLAELMARLGHSTTQAAMRYQHASEDRDSEIARLLSKLATAAADVV